MKILNLHQVNSTSSIKISLIFRVAMYPKNQSYFCTIKKGSCFNGGVGLGVSCRCYHSWPCSLLYIRPIDRNVFFFSKYQTILACNGSFFLSFFRYKCCIFIHILFNSNYIFNRNILGHSTKACEKSPVVFLLM